MSYAPVGSRVPAHDGNDTGIQTDSETFFPDIFRHEPTDSPTMIPSEQQGKIGGAAIPSAGLVRGPEAVPVTESVGNSVESATRMTTQTTPWLATVLCVLLLTK
jgi:hypothetical protein